MRLRKRYAGEMFLKAGRDARGLFEGADLVIYKTPLKIAFWLSRLTGVPCIEAGLVPVLPTARDAGVLLGGRDLGASLNRIATSFVHRSLFRACKESIDVLGREVEGLAPYRVYEKSARTSFHTDPILYAFSPSVYPKPDDWGENVHLTGYWFLPPEPSWTPPAELTAFIESGEPPIYFGFGSMTNTNPVRVLAMFSEALEHLGARGIVSAGWAGIGASLASPPRMRIVGYLPHDWLFPKVAVAVHHGGAGTTAAALRAGIPSVVVPHVGDQAVWGRILRRLGVAPRGIPIHRLSADRLERALREALAEGRMRKRAREIAAVLAAEDGVARAVEVIESYAASREAS
jgi:sterol 3beta-glucosyltransferase